MPDHASESQNDSHAVKSALLLQAEAAIASRKAREAEAREVEVELDYIDASADPIEPAPESLPDESDAQEVTPQEAQRQNSERFLASLNGPKPKTARKSVKAPWQIETARYRREEGRVVRNLYARTLYGVNKRTNEGCAPRDYVTGLPPEQDKAARRKVKGKERKAKARANMTPEEKAAESAKRAASRAKNI